MWAGGRSRCGLLARAGEGSSYGWVLGCCGHPLVAETLAHAPCAWSWAGARVAASLAAQRPSRASAFARPPPGAYVGVIPVLCTPREAPTLPPDRGHNEGLPARRPWPGRAPCAMPSAAVSSAAGLLTLLEEDNDDIKQYALSKLDGVVNDYFFEISPSIAAIEALYEDEGFKDRELAALLASKVRRRPIGGLGRQGRARERRVGAAMRAAGGAPRMRPLRCTQRPCGRSAARGSTGSTPALDRRSVRQRAGSLTAAAASAASASAAERAVALLPKPHRPHSPALPGLLPPGRARLSPDLRAGRRRPFQPQ